MRNRVYMPIFAQQLLRIKPSFHTLCGTLCNDPWAFLIIHTHGNRRGTTASSLCRVAAPLVGEDGGAQRPDG